MAGLSPQTVLRRVEGIRLHLDSSGMRLFLPGSVVGCGPHGLAVLDAFSQPMSFAAALERLRPRTGGAHDWAELVRTIVRLHDCGVLVDEAGAPRTHTSGYDPGPGQAAMLQDRTRTSAFLAAIREVVRRGDVVVDLGTGTGVLAVAAARAGAARVYAIEVGAIAACARKVIEANGVADRVAIVEGWSTRVSLPERADVLVSETVGDDPLGESILEFFADARRRLLKPDARMIPSRLRLMAVALTMPRRHDRPSIGPGALRRWRSWYGIDFSPLAEAERASPRRVFVNPFHVRRWRALGAPLLLADIDLRSAQGLDVPARATLRTGSAGRLDAFLIFFELSLGPTASLTTDPRRVRRDNHWLSPLWRLADPFFLRPGERVSLTLTGGAGRPVVRRAATRAARRTPATADTPRSS